MRLENLYSNFGTASPEDQAAFMSAYRLRRAEDMAKPSTRPRKNVAGKGSKIDLSLTDEEKTLMKILGLKKKDMLLLRSSIEEVEDTDDTTLLSDDTFTEEDD